ncbi:MAG TPA: hypothetical protein VKA40_04285 [Nitrososphaera sp.]|nr:hypothetical protein [Nitrososphaera sp.]
MNIVFAATIQNNIVSINQQKIYEAYHRRTSSSIQILGGIGTNHHHRK